MKYYLIAFVFIGIIWSTNAQTDSNKKIDVNTDVDVTIVYEQVVREGYGTPFIYKELAVAFYFKNDHVNAKKWFEKLFEVEKVDDETMIFRYKQTLKALEVSNENKVYLSDIGDPD